MAKALNAGYRRYHPKWHRERVPIFWWVRSASYIKFMCRELTSLFVAYAAGLLLVQVWALGQGAAAHARLLNWLSHPAVVTGHVVLLATLLFHTVTWLNLTPQALVLRLGRWRVPKAVVWVGHYAVWLVLSLVIVWLFVEVA
jgi:fumarate reductase subunit C